MNAVRSNINLQIKRVNQNINAIREAGRFMQENRDIIKKTINDYADNLKQIQAWIEKLKEYQTQEKDLFLQSGWWFTPSILEQDADIISDSIAKYKTGDVRSITNLFASIYQKDDCAYLEQVVENWQNNKYFIPWKKQLTQALDAHKRKQYFLSIPLLLIIAEGFTKNYCENNKKLKKWMNRKDNSKNIKIAFDHFKTMSDDAKWEVEIMNVDELFFTAINKNIYNDTKHVKNARGFKYILNRHAVLHGQSKHYGTRKNSLQAFMILDVLSLLE